jgi:glycosyltransferase involved in cell wall biosynthesis|tara:strand:- start:152 stop:757 length:606 start_codon:yes stop_codon:yes gene_type:complete
MNRSVDILIPTYNRFKFSEQISKNINLQLYPFINKIIVADDSDIDPKLNIISKYPIEYHKVDRMSIGAKRNFLQSKSTAYYTCNMDTDDIYNPEYISRSIFNLIRTGKYITGSADMIMLKDNEYYIHRCSMLTSLNEATIVCVNNKRQYNETNSSEGLGFLSGMASHIVETNIKDIMVCLVHSDNSVNKSKFLKEKCSKPF